MFNKILDRIDDKILNTILVESIFTLIIMLIRLYFLFSARNNAVASIFNYNAMISSLLVPLWLLGTTLIILLSFIKRKHYPNLSGIAFVKEIAQVVIDALRFKRSFTEMLEFNTTADPYQLDITAYPAIGWNDIDGIVFGEKNGHCIYRPPTAEGNVALFARPGAGKTSCQIIPSALQFGGSVFAIDIKGDILAATFNKRYIKIFDPARPESSCHFDPFRNIQNMSSDDRRVRIEQLANILIAEKKSGTKEDDYFTKGARNYFAGIAHYMLDSDHDTQFSDVINALVYGKFGNAVDIVKMVVDGNSESAKSYLSQYYGTNERNIQGCYADAVDSLRPLAGSLASILNSEGDCISIETLTKHHYDIYIEVAQDRLEVYSPLITMIIQSFIEEFMRLPDKSSRVKSRQILFLLDEFAQLRFDFKTISTALATLRSKNVSLFLAMQSVAQLANRYSDSQAREIIDNCAYISVMDAQDPQSREFFSRMIGEKKVLRKSTSGSVEVVERIIPPEKFGNFGDKVLIYNQGKYVLAEKCYYFKVPEDQRGPLVYDTDGNGAHFTIMRSLAIPDDNEVK